ncbi:PREDICTED: deoxynucleotidyltransferase terminal-interacting protein 2 [Ceratosolen solmsi marchali]|uniref:Deoxynucleotidyltransferase terminal-interacting protein 2 n=1 Tax=Ceratosolen solmsi marchali TaxID=326594 RepID=A0AAJ7E3H0_9HYME|nr:PREDICTED: deoxynucleotidyltransferase terminal-interacting protein 2 [Ceratosolen solmsi marchali]
MEFIIDTKGQTELKGKDKLIEDDDDDDVEIEEIGLDVTKIINRDGAVTKKKVKRDYNDIDLGEFERDMGWKRNRHKKASIDKDVKMIVNEVAPIEKALKKSVVKPGFERLKRVPGYDTSDQKLKATRKGQRSRTKGKDWFNLPATEMTAEVRHDLEIIRMRSVLDPKHFYKKNDMKVLPKYFHIGKVVDTPLDYYSGRLTKKERKRTIVDELMADAQFAKYNKRKYKEIIDEKRKRQYKAYRHAKKLKRKGKSK